MYFIRTDAAGDTLWTKKWGPVGPDGVKDMMLTADSGFVIIGETSWPNGAITVMRTDSALDTLWVKQYVHTGFSDLPHRINSTVDGGYIIAGTSYVGSSSAQDVLIIKIDSAGNYQWSKMYGDGGDSGEDAVSVEQATDGGFFIGGGRFGGSPYYYNPYLIKTDAQGLSGCFENNLKTLANSLPLVKGNTQTLVHLYIPTVTNPTPGLWYGGIEYDICSSTVGISEYELLSQINIYPNPFSENLIIEMKSAEPVELILYDVTSRRLIQQLFIKSTRINTGQLAQGIYLYEVRNQRGVIKTGKVIK
jgi:hypothetical protein